MGYRTLPANGRISNLLRAAALALALTFFVEYLDDRIKTPEEVKTHLGLSFIGMVPALFDKNLHDPLMSNVVPPNFAEAFRARLSGQQSDELREFFAEEMTRASMALGANA